MIQIAALWKNDSSNDEYLVIYDVSEIWETD